MVAALVPVEVLAASDGSTHPRTREAGCGVHCVFKGGSIMVHGKLRNTGNNYIAELAGALAAVHNAPTNARLTLYVDNKAVWHVLRPIVLAFASGVRYEWTEQRRIRMAGAPLIKAFHSVIYSRTATVDLVHQRSHTDENTVSARLLACADRSANCL